MSVAVSPSPYTPSLHGDVLSTRIVSNFYVYITPLSEARDVQRRMV